MQQQEGPATAKVLLLQQLLRAVVVLLLLLLCQALQLALLTELLLGLMGWISTRQQQEEQGRQQDLPLWQ